MQQEMLAPSCKGILEITCPMAQGNRQIDSTQQEMLAPSCKEILEIDQR